MNQKSNNLQTTTTNSPQNENQNNPNNQPQIIFSQYPTMMYPRIHIH